MDDDASTSTNHGELGDESITSTGIKRLSSNAIDEIALLARSPSRVRVLHLLREQAPVKKREIRERVDGVRTTVTRNLSALEEHGWIEQTQSGYVITDCGRLVADELDQLVDSMSVAVDLRPALRWLDVDRLGVGLQEFEEADITTADSANPYAPVEEQIDFFRHSSSVRTALPTVNKQILRACRQAADANNADVTLILGAKTAERLRSEPRYESLLTEVKQECTLLRHETTLPHYVAVDEGTVHLGATDDDRLTRVLLQFDDDPSARSWAEERLSALEAAAEPMG